jgi:hypothetical protein
VNEGTLRQKDGLPFHFFNSEKGPLIVLPKNYGIEKKSIYIGVDLSQVDPETSAGPSGPYKR